MKRQHQAENNEMKKHLGMSERLANIIAVAVCQFIDRNTNGMCTANIECTTLCKCLQQGRFDEIEKWLNNKKWK